MNLYMVLFCLFCLIYSEKVIDLGPDDHWTQYKMAYGLNFGKNEEKVRKAIFLENLNFIEEFNAKNTGSRLGMNQFAHLRPYELGSGVNGKVPKLSNEVKVSHSDLPVGESIDWRKFGAVTSVKSQGDCDASYAFSGVGAMESHYAIQTGVLEELSAQEVIDCFHHFSARGCYGGFHDSVFEYAIEHGLSLENDYKYTGLNGTCQAGSKTGRHKLTSYIMIPQFDEHELVRVLSFLGPVSLMVSINPRPFMFYKSGIVDDSYCDENDTSTYLDVLAVGYNTESENPYLIIKNSWGINWGEEGYFRIVLFKNMCELAADPTYPIISRDLIMGRQ